MLHNLKRLLSRFWFFGFIAVAIHYAVFRVYEIFGWPAGNVLDYLDGPGFQIVNTVQLLLDRPVLWAMLRDPNESMASVTWFAGLIVVSLGWFLLGISLPSLWPFGLKRNERRELARTAVRYVSFLAVLVTCWYAIVVVNTYWGTIKSLGVHYVDCGTIGNWPPGDAREVQSKRKLQAAFTESRNAKILALYPDSMEYEYLVIEFGRKGCILRTQFVSRIERKLCGLDIRGWGRTLTYNVESVTIIDRGTAKELMGRNWIPLNGWREFLAIKVRNAPTLVY